LLAIGIFQNKGECIPMARKPLVSVIMGSDSDLAVMAECVSKLEELGIPSEVRVLSAHRTPDLTAEFAKSAKRRGIKVIIAGAGGAAHLAGVVASHTNLPVIGVPISSKLNGLDSLLSTVQMPSGIPVATVAIGTAGAVNAAVLAGRILGLSSSPVSKKLNALKKKMVRKVKDKNKRISI
jgi:phosphoribosylaminoimidazole carboxylase PurE protein